MSENLVKKIHFEIIKSRPIQLHFNNTHECGLFPHRLAYLDGILSVIGEDVQNKQLKVFAISEINSVEEMDYGYEQNFSQIEVGEFINDLRLINGKQARLVIKFHAMAEVDVLPEYHYLHNPYVTTNTEGDMIWAATIEMCDDVFLWLYTMKDQIEILDPSTIRKEFAVYCDFQKAS